MEDIANKIEDFSNDDEIIGAYDAVWHREETERVVRLANIEEAREEGFSQGMAQGMAQGIDQGIEQGALDKSYEIVRNMLKEKMDIKFISKITGLNVDEIKKI